MEIDFVDSEDEIIELVFEGICDLPWYDRFGVLFMVAVFPKWSLARLHEAVEKRKKNEKNT